MVHRFRQASWTSWREAWRAWEREREKYRCVWSPQSCPAVVPACVGCRQTTGREHQAGGGGQWGGRQWEQRLVVNYWQDECQTEIEMAAAGCQPSVIPCIFHEKAVLLTLKQRLAQAGVGRRAKGRVGEDMEALWHFPVRHRGCQRGYLVGLQMFMRAVSWVGRKWLDGVCFKHFKSRSLFSVCLYEDVFPIKGGGESGSSFNIPCIRHD